MGITEREAAAEAAELVSLRAEVQRLESLRPHPLHRTGHRCACCGREGAPEADTLCPWCREAQEVEAQRDEARGALADATAQRDKVRADMREALEAAEMLATMERARAAMDRVEAVTAAETAGVHAVRDAVMSYLEEVFPGGPAATDERWPHELMERVAAAVAKTRAGGA